MTVACLFFDSYTDTQKVAEHCLRFSPQICLRGNEAVFIEIGKCRRLYSERSFLARMQVILNRLELKASIGLGNDITDALLNAKYQTDDINELPLSALVDLADPFNKDLIVQKYVHKMINAFTDLGIKTLAQFKQIPSGELISRFGPVGILCRQRVTMETPIPWPRWKPEEVIFEKYEFPYFEFYGELEPILFELKKQLDSIFQRLWARGLKAQSMEVKVFCETTSFNPHPFRHFHFDFMYPQSATKGTLTIIKERLSRDFEKRPIRTPIEGLETRVLKTIASQAGQRNLLNNNEEIKEQLFTLLNQLSESHGKQNIFQAELTEDRRPERSWKKVDVNSSPSSVLLTGRIPRRPTYLMKPERVQVTAGFMYIRKKPYRILKWSENVERITGGWIEKATDLNNSYSRNYYEAELESDNGAQGTATVTVTVFETPEQNFFLHGYYG